MEEIKIAYSPIAECQAIEETKDASIPSVSSASERLERKKYLKQTGKSLWMKNKAKKNNTLSIDISTRSTESSSSFLNSNHQGSTNEKEKGIYSFLDFINVKQVNFSELMQTTVITSDKKVKFLSNVHDALLKSSKAFEPKKVSSLWERRKLCK